MHLHELAETCGLATHLLKIGKADEKNIRRAHEQACRGQQQPGFSAHYRRALFQDISGAAPQVEHVLAQAAREIPYSFEEEGSIGSEADALVDMLVDERAQGRVFEPVAEYLPLLHTFSARLSALISERLAATDALSRRETETIAYLLLDAQIAMSYLLGGRARASVSRAGHGAATNA